MSAIMIDDLDRIMEVMAAAFEPQWGEAWTRRQISDSLVLPTTQYRLIGYDGAVPQPPQPVAGFTLSRSAVDEEELLLIAVLPECRGAGLGRKLLENLAKDAQARGAERLFLEMRSNNPAEKLYRAFGFVPVGRRKQYYRQADGNKLDAITFALSI